MKSLDQTFAALSDATRRGVIDRLRRGPVRAGDLAEAARVSPPVMSRHLRVLRSAGLIEEEHQGIDARVRVYRLRRERFAAAQRWLAEIEEYWSHQLEAFKEHAERTRGRSGKAR